MNCIPNFLLGIFFDLEIDMVYKRLLTMLLPLSFRFLYKNKLFIFIFNHLVAFATGKLMSCLYRNRIRLNFTVYLLRIPELISKNCYKTLLLYVGRGVLFF